MTTDATVFLAWNDSWLVGVREIDAQHHHLVSLLNQLHDSMSKGHGKSVLAGILTSLVHYTSAHFTAEERLMQEHGYPDLASHKREHNTLTATVVDYQRRFQAGEVALSLEVMEFLSNWLRNHILGTDRKYVPCLHSKGVR